MLPLGLRAAELRTFHQALADNHTLKVNVAVMNLDGDILIPLDPDLIDGQVDFDAKAPVTRSLSLQILDRKRSLNFDSDSPSDGALYVDRMLRVTYSVRADDTLGWVDVPVFTGPVTTLDRADDIVNVVAQGKEALSMGAAWIPSTYKKGHSKVAVIRSILADTGETRFDLPDLTARLHKPLSLGRQSVPWLVCQRIAKSMNRQLFYDGRGIVRMRNVPGNVFTFKTGNGGSIVAFPKVAYSTDNTKNIVWVKGGKPRGVKEGTDEAKKTPDIQAHLVAPRSHPLSPQRLGRNGKPRYLLEVIDNPKIRSKKEALRVAHRHLDDLLLQAVDVQCDTLPIPHLEELDKVRFVTDEGSFSIRLTKWSLPLSTASPMSVGNNRRLTINRRRIR